MQDFTEEVNVILNVSVLSIKICNKKQEIGFAIGFGIEEFDPDPDPDPDPDFGLRA